MEAETARHFFLRVCSHMFTQQCSYLAEDCAHMLHLNEQLFTFDLHLVSKCAFPHE